MLNSNTGSPIHGCCPWEVMTFRVSVTVNRCLHCMPHTNSQFFASPALCSVVTSGLVRNPKKILGDNFRNSSTNILHHQTVDYHHLLFEYILLKSCNMYHAVLLFEHQCAIFIAFKQRLLKSKILGDGIEDDRLQLLVIANQYHLISVLERHQWNEALRFHAHSALINDDLIDVCSHSQPWTRTGRASAQNYVIVT